MAAELSWQECLKLAPPLRRMCGAVPRGSQKWIEYVPLMVKRMSGPGFTLPGQLLSSKIPLTQPTVMHMGYRTI